ncbi:DacC D-alanyl-D-alanine carboxypeptidase [Burkholderiales bacterium]
MHSRRISAALCLLGLWMFIVWSVPGRAQGWPQPPALASPSFMLIDLTTGQALTGRQEDMAVSPGGLTLLMTAYLGFQAIRERRLSPRQVLPTPAESSIPPGPRMFLGPEGASVQDLLTGILVIGAQDAALTLALGLAESEAQFVQTMNQTAARVGMANTRFVNATGAPGPDAQTTARDMALLAAQLHREFPEAFEKSQLRSLRFNGILQTNKNRLLWLDRSVDGLFATDFAGLSSGLVTTNRPQPLGPVERSQRRLLVVLLEAPNADQRSQETLKLLNFGYQQFDLVRLFSVSHQPLSLPVYKGVAKALKASFRQDVKVAVPRGLASQLRLELQHPKGLVAPITAGQPVGLLRVWLGDLEIHRVEVIAAESIKPAGLLGRAIDSLVLLWQAHGPQSTPLNP